MLNPRVDRRARVCIVGAGAAGLAAARALLRAGYEDLTVLEAEPEVGGKCRSATIAGRPYDLGAMVFFDGYTRTLALAAEAGVELAELATYTHREGERWARPAAAKEAVEWATALADRVPGVLEAALGDEEAVGALGLDEPFGAWAERVGLAPIPSANLHLYQSTGYGYAGDEIPAIYFLRAQLACTGRSYQAVGGFARLWTAWAERLNAEGVRVRCGRPVREVRAGLEIHAGDEVHRADALIWAAGPDAALAALPLSEEQRRILGQMRHVDYRSWVIEAEGLTEDARRLIMVERNNRPEHRGHVTLYARPQADRPLYLVWQYAAGDDGADARTALADLSALGAETARVRAGHRWLRYFPHFGPEAIRAKDPVRLERSQGTGHIYFAGGTLSMELVEYAVRHAEGVVSRHFPP